MNEIACIFLYMSDFQHYFISQYNTMTQHIPRSKTLNTLCFWNEGHWQQSSWMGIDEV